MSVPGASRISMQTGYGRKAIVLFIVVSVVAFLVWYVRGIISIEELVAHEVRLRAAITHAGIGSMFVGVAVYTSLSLVPGTGGKAIIAGWLFGFTQAIVVVMIGLTVAAMVIFSLSRYLLRDYVEHRYTRFVSLMNKHIEREGAFYLLTLRLAHAPYSIINPVSGASRVPVSTFLWTTILGLLPGSIVWIYVGVRIPSLQELLDHGSVSLLDPVLIAALVFSASLPALIRAIFSHIGIPSVDKSSRTQE